MGSPIRVLHVVVNMNRGGAETLIMNLYRNIDRSKVQFDFLTCKEGVFDSEIKAMGGQIYRIPYVSDVGHRGYVRELHQFFQRHSYYKIVHSHMDKISGLVLRAAKKAGILNRIAHSHSTKSEGGTLSKLYKWYVGQFIQGNATHFYACSRNAARWLYPSKKIVPILLKNGIEIRKFSFSNSTRKIIREELSISEQTFVIGHVGRFSYPKNHDYLIDVFAQFHRVRRESILLLVGEGPLRKDIENKVRKLSLENDVIFLGTRNDVNHILQAVDILAFPSRYEGFPVTLVEAQAAGLTCVISDRITPEVNLGIKLIHHLPLNNVKSWVSQLVERADKPFSREEYNLRLIEKEYDIRTTGSKLQSYYLWMGRELNEEVNHLHPNIQ